uniref:Uncharacterized protein n=1 Tax=Salarias fasciatus TaxID=181472 RepID=A0A672H314_SALFA
RVSKALPVPLSPGPARSSRLRPALRWWNDFPVPVTTRWSEQASLRLLTENSSGQEAPHAARLPNTESFPIPQFPFSACSHMFSSEESHPPSLTSISISHLRSIILSGLHSEGRLVLTPDLFSIGFL